MVTAHIPENSQGNLFYQLMIMVCFTETAPQKLDTKLAYLEKLHKQKERMRGRVVGGEGEV